MMRIFPRSYLCCGCKRRFDACDTEFVYKRSCICKSCYSEFGPYSKDGYFDATGGLDFVAAAYRYKGLYRRIFLDFKFRENVAAGHLLGMAIARQMSLRDAFGEYSYIVPVPISKLRYRERGYNQSEVFSDYISKAIGTNVIKALDRIKHTAPQSEGRNHTRRENVKDAYVATQNFCGENIILIDDIYTTGSTASECAKTLRKAGAGKICIIVGGYNLPEYSGANIL